MCIYFKKPEVLIRNEIAQNALGLGVVLNYKKLIETVITVYNMILQIPEVFLSEYRRANYLVAFCKSRLRYVSWV